MLYAIPKQLPNGMWAIVCIEQFGTWTNTHYSWRNIASRLPIGEKKFKKRAKELGGTIELIDSYKMFGLAGEIYCDISSIAFLTLEQAELAIEELITPIFLAKNLSEKN